MIKFIIRRFYCKMNIHYHPENDGFYVEDLSCGRYYCCGKIIKKTNNGWKEYTDDL